MKTKIEKKKWASLVAKGRCEFVLTDNSRTCSNHFLDGKPTNKNPNPVLYLTLDDYRRPKQINMWESPSKKRKASSCSLQQKKNNAQEWMKRTNVLEMIMSTLPLQCSLLKLLEKVMLDFLLALRAQKVSKKYSTVWYQEPD